MQLCWAVNVQSTGSHWAEHPQAAGGSTPERGFLGLWVKGNSPISSKTPKTVESLPFVTVLKQLINLKGVFILALSVLIFLKLQFRSLCTQLFQGRQMGSFTPGTDCHFSPHSILHPHQETAQINAAALPAGCATGSEPVVLPSTSMHLGTKSLDRFTGIILYMQITDVRSTSICLK